MDSRNDSFHDREVIDRSGEKVGKVTDVIFDDSTLDPSWLVVKPGLLKAEHYVPVTGAVTEGGELVVIPYDVETVRSSPKATGDHTLSTAARSVLRDHYHLAHS